MSLDGMRDLDGPGAEEAAADRQRLHEVSKQFTLLLSNASQLVPTLKSDLRLVPLRELLDRLDKTAFPPETAEGAALQFAVMETLNQRGLRGVTEIMQRCYRAEFLQRNELADSTYLQQQT